MNPYKLLIVAAIIGVLASLGWALFHLSSDQGDPDKMLRALKLRIGLSVLLFLMLFVAWYFGLISPHQVQR